MIADPRNGDEERIRLGVSGCLLGQPVRFDGGHKRDTFLTDVLARFVDWVPVCPEEEAGLGTPREAMRLVHQGGAERLVTVRSQRDLTDTLEQQTATGEILRVISSSPTDAQPVFDTIAESAHRLCSAELCQVFRSEDGLLYFVASRGQSPEGLAAARRAFPRPLDQGTASGRASEPAKSGSEHAHS